MPCPSPPPTLYDSLVCLPLSWLPAVPASPVALRGAPPGWLRRPAPAVCGAWGQPRACSRVASRVTSNQRSCRQLFNTSQSLPMINGHGCRTSLAAHALTKACAAIWPHACCNNVTLRDLRHAYVCPRPYLGGAGGSPNSLRVGGAIFCCLHSQMRRSACNHSGRMEGPAVSGATSLGLCQPQVCSIDKAATAPGMP